MLGMCLKLTHFQTNDGSESCRQRPSHVLEVFYKVYKRKDISITHYNSLNFELREPGGSTKILTFRFAQPQVSNFVRLAKVELVPSADIGGVLKGVGNLTKDALTFKWAQATMKDVAVNTVVVVEVIS